MGESLNIKVGGEDKIKYIIINADLIRIPLNFKIRSLTQPNRKFLAAKHPLGDVQHVQRGTLVVFPFVFAYRTSFHPDDKS